MGTSLIGLLPQNTYSGLIKVGNNTALNTTLKTLSDGAGNDLPMQASTTGINFTGTVSGVASGVSGAIQFSNGSAFASDASNLFWDDTNNRLGVGTNAPLDTIDAKGVIRVSRTDAANYYLTMSAESGFGRISSYGGIGLHLNETTNTVLKIQSGDVTIGNNITMLPARLGIKGSGSTSATTSLLVQNSGGSNALQVQDNLNTTFGGTLQLLNGNTYIANQSSTIVFAAVNTATADLHMIPSRQMNINNTGVYTAQASALLQVDSTTKGFLPPRMTTTQKNAIASPAEGLQMYDSTAKSPAYYDGTNWGYTGGALQNASGNSGTLNISFAAGNIVNLTLNATTTLAFSNAVIGTYIIQVTQGATGANSLAYPASVKWAGGTPPTLSTAVGKTDILTFYYDGTFYYGTYSLNY